MRILRNFKVGLVSLSFAMISACGGHIATEGSSSASAAKQAVTLENKMQAPSTGLLDSLANLYPNGQMGSQQKLQAASQLLQNPAALRMKVPGKMLLGNASISSQSAATVGKINANTDVLASAASDFGPVFRIQNTTLSGSYFFTIYDSEKLSALALHPEWNLEGAAFFASKVADTTSNTGLHPVHRFQNKINGSYLYTIYEAERADILANYSNYFAYEGISWYARQSADTGYTPLYRFRNKENGTYLFSAYESEKEQIIANYSNIFVLEGVAYFVRLSAPNAAAGGNVNGQITSNVDSTPVSGATVSMGAYSTVTDASGNFTLSNMPATDRTVARITKAGFSEWLQTTAVVADTTITISSKLRPVGANVALNSNTGGTVTVPSSVAQVILPANGVALSSGASYSGTFNVAVTPVNPSLDVNAMPGGYQVSSSSAIESWGALNVTLTGSAGQRLNLAAGKTAAIRIPVTTRNSILPATIPLFYFSETTGYWVQEGAATLTGTSPNQYYAGVVTHFSYWNADQALNTVYVNGCVSRVDTVAGVSVVGRVPNVRVSSDGIDYSGASTAYTDAAGNFRIAIKSNGRAAISGVQLSRLTNTVSVGPSTSEITLSTCLDLAELANATSIKLTWGTSPSDLDSHLFTPDGSHIYYSDKGTLVSDPYSNLDVDDTSSYGPEVITIRNLMVGTYTYSVYNYSRTSTPGITGSPAHVELTRSGTLQAFSPSAGETPGTTNWWNVFALTVSANCDVTVTPLNTWSATQPAPTPIAKQYCVRS
jgi:Carboxypeptidase regulatory-like domain/Repeat of unknown function (DUF5648)